MIIPVDQRHRINSDRYQWIIQERADYKDKSGDLVENWKAVGYHPTLETAVNALYDMKLRLSDVEGLSTALEFAQQTAKQLENALKPILKVDSKAVHRVSE